MIDVAPIVTAARLVSGYVDDTATIQSVLDDVPYAQQGIVFGPVTNGYSISEALRPYSGTWLEWEHQYHQSDCTIRQSNPDAACFKPKPLPGAPSTNEIVFINPGIEGPANSTAAGFDFGFTDGSWGDHFTIRNCRVSRFKQGYLFAKCANSKLEASWAQDCERGLQIGIYVSEEEQYGNCNALRFDRLSLIKNSEAGIVIEAPNPGNLFTCIEGGDNQPVMAKVSRGILDWHGANVEGCGDPHAIIVGHNGRLHLRRPWLRAGNYPASVPIYAEMYALRVTIEDPTLADYSHFNILRKHETSNVVTDFIRCEPYTVELI